MWLLAVVALLLSLACMAAAVARHPALPTPALLCRSGLIALAAWLARPSHRPARFTRVTQTRLYAGERMVSHPHYRVW